MKAKNQRLALVAAAIVAVLAAVLLAMLGLKDRASYFLSPADIAAGKAVDAQAIRLGGMVERGSIQRQPDGVTIRFVVTDGKARTPVSYRGIMPDLFREGKGVVAQGQLGPDGIFQAREVLAKQDENYMPPEAADAVKRTHQTAEKTAKTLKP